MVNKDICNEILIEFRYIFSGASILEVKVF